MLCDSKAKQSETNDRIQGILINMLKNGFQELLGKCLQLGYLFQDKDFLTRFAARTDDYLILD